MMELSKLPLFNDNWKHTLFMRYNKRRCVDIGGRDGKFSRCFIQYQCIDPKPMNSNVMLGRAESIPIKKGWTEFIIFNHVIEHVTDLDKSKQEIDRISKQGCVMFIAFPNPLNPFYYDEPTHVNQMSIKQVITLFTGWDVMARNASAIRFLPYGLQRIIFTVLPFLFSEFYIIMKKQ